MTEPLTIDGYGDANWVDQTDNWRDADATWLQERSIVRINVADPSSSTPGTAGTSNFTIGRVFFNDNNDSLVVSMSSSAPYSFKTIASSNHLSIKDGVSTSELKATLGADGTGITINNTTGAVSIGAASLTSTLSVAGATTLTGFLTSLKAGSAGSISTSSSGLVINTSGSNAVTVTTSTAVGAATTLEINNPVRITGSINTTAGANITGTTALTGGLTVSGTSALSATTVSTTLGISGLTTAAAITASGTVTVNGAGGVVTNAITSVAGAGLAITVPNSQNMRISAPTSADAYANNIYYGSTSVRNAWVYYGSDPGVALVPEGTIWIS